MTILQATKDLRKVSLWLGHSSVQTTEIYTRADPTVKLETLEAAIAPRLRTGRFKATDKLIALLKAPTIMRGKGAIPRRQPSIPWCGVCITADSALSRRWLLWGIYDGPSRAER